VQADAGGPNRVSKCSLAEHRNYSGAIRLRRGT
jgi:hypothetical protein